MPHCKGICDTFKYTTKDTRQYYKNDIVYCSGCMLGFPLDPSVIFCPCCHTRVRRTKTHKTNWQKYKWKLYGGHRMIKSKDKLTYTDLKTLKIGN